jgi:hypothetical protein
MKRKPLDYAKVGGALVEIVESPLEIRAGPNGLATGWDSTAQPASSKARTRCTPVQSRQQVRFTAFVG